MSDQARKAQLILAGVSFLERWEDLLHPVEPHLSPGAWVGQTTEEPILFLSIFVEVLHMILHSRHTCALIASPRPHRHVYPVRALPPLLCDPCSLQSKVAGAGSSVQIFWSLRPVGGRRQGHLHQPAPFLHQTFHYTHRSGGWSQMRSDTVVQAKHLPEEIRAGESTLFLKGDI